MKAKSKLAEELRGSLSQGLQKNVATARTDKHGRILFSGNLTPGPSNTPDQATWRARYAACVDQWNGLSDGEKAGYQSDADKRRITAFNQFMSSCLLAPSEKLYERYVTYPDTAAVFYDYWWFAQTFTVGNTGDNEDHVLARVELMLYKIEDGTEILVKIRAVDGAGKPTGPDLSTGITDVNTLPLWPNHTWRSIDMSAYTLQAGTKYAVIVAYPSGTGFKRVTVGHDQTALTYTGGQFWHSFDSGVSWYIYYNWDMWFKIFGAPA